MQLFFPLWLEPYQPVSFRQMNQQSCIEQRFRGPDPRENLTIPSLLSLPAHRRDAPLSGLLNPPGHTVNQHFWQPRPSRAAAPGPLLACPLPPSGDVALEAGLFWQFFEKGRRGSESRTGFGFVWSGRLFAGSEARGICSLVSSTVWAFG